MSDPRTQQQPEADTPPPSTNPPAASADAHNASVRVVESGDERNP